MGLLEWECENALPFKERMRRCGIHVAIAERERERERERYIRRKKELYIILLLLKTTYFVKLKILKK